MTSARSVIVKDNAEGIYHCISRCVRRAFLCGRDPLTDRNYDHRKKWLRLRLMKLSNIFLIDVCGYAIMDNHFHAILRTRPDRVASCSDEEIAKRWLRLFPGKGGMRDRFDEPAGLALNQLIANSPRLFELRKRLSSISWFMRCLKENIARQANREDRCTGRFWEGRFKSIALLDQAAVLTCAAYVDLNPIRSGISTTPETSDFTSIKDRISAMQAKKKARFLNLSTTFDRKSIEDFSEAAKQDQWLCPLRNEAGRRGFLPVDLEVYLKLLDWTGRQVVKGKKGAIPGSLAPVLERLEIDHKRWCHGAMSFGSVFYRVAGKVSSIANFSHKIGQKWLKGKSSGEAIFLTG